MASKNWVHCATCGSIASPRKAVWNAQRTEVIKPEEVGTSTVMRCEDCADSTGHASMCRDCCPTGHGTRQDADTEWGEEQEPPPSCPACSGTGMFLGQLGSREHFRCRNCGMDFSRVVTGCEA